MDSKPLRIGIDCRVLQQTNYSGIPSYAYNIINGITSIDQENKYVLFFNFFKNIRNVLPDFDKRENVEYRIYRFPNNLFEASWRFLSFPKIDKLLGVDIFFSPHIHSIPLSKKTKKILTAHDLSFLKNKNYFNHKSNLWHWFMNPKKMCRSYDKIIAVSESTRNDLVNIYKVPRERVTVIHNGVASNTPKIQEINEQDILKKFGVERGSYYLFISTLEPRKNIEGIIEAVKILGDRLDRKILFAGKKGWKYKEIFKKAASKDIKDKTSFIGFISEEEKSALLANSFGFIFPSYFEGFGIPIIEAVKNKLPIVTSFNSAIPEIIKSGGIMVNPHFVNEISSAIYGLEKSSALRSKIIEKSSEGSFSTWEESARKTLDCILN